MGFSTIIVSEDGPVQRISFNRPKNLNAFSIQLLEELIDVLDQTKDRADITIVIFSGEGRAFSAGVDLKATQSTSFGGDTGVIELGMKVDAAINSLPQVTIGQVHGYCFTGALEIALFFDLLYCDESTIFGDTHTKWAIMPRWGITQRFARRVGLNKAKELSFRAMKFDGKYAEKIGLVNEAFADGTLADEVDKIAQEIQQNSAEAIARIKSVYNTGYGMTLNDGLQHELDTDPVFKDTARILAEFEQRKNSK